MDKILLRIEEAESKQIQKKAAELGLTTSAYIRQVLKDSLKNSNRKEPPDSIKATRALVHVVSEALGRTQNASPEAIEKLSKILLKKFDQEVQ